MQQKKKYKKTPPICQSVEQYIPDIVVVVPFFVPDLRAWIFSSAWVMKEICVISREAI